MQDETKISYRIGGERLKKERLDKGAGFNMFCYENDIPKTTYNEIVKGKNKASFYNIFKIIRALGLSFEDFVRKLDSALPPEIWELDD